MRRSIIFFTLIIGAWLSLTCFIDFLAVPKVFQNVSSREQAGTLGMIIFSSFNKLELIFSTLCFTSFYFFKDMIKFKKLTGSFLIGLFVLALVYNFHMTPKIIESNEKKWELAEQSKEYKKYDQIHQFYHSLFKKTDSVKILILLGNIVMLMRLRNSEMEKSI